MYIYIHSPQFLEAEGQLELSSFLHDAIIKSVSSIEKYINKNQLYRKFPCKRVKDMIMIEIDNVSCVRNIMTVAPVLKI